MLQAAQRTTTPPMASVAVPIVFPDYEITVGTKAVTVDVPDWIPAVPNEVKVPALQQRVPFLGHAGILFLDRRGVTKYYEYGRYDPAEMGMVRRHLIPDAAPGPDGKPVATTLHKALARVSSLAGHGGRIAAAWIDLADDAFNRMLVYAAARVRSNGDPRRRRYDILEHSCLHFMRDVAIAGGATMPAVLDPRPAGYIDRVRASFPALDYRPQGGVVFGGEAP